MDWSRPVRSSARLPVCGPVQSDLAVGLVCTDPYLRTDPSGRVKTLSNIRPITIVISPWKVLSLADDGPACVRKRSRSRMLEYSAIGAKLTNFHRACCCDYEGVNRVYLLWCDN